MKLSRRRQIGQLGCVQRMDMVVDRLRIGLQGQEGWVDSSGRSPNTSPSHIGSSDDRQVDFFL